MNCLRPGMSRLTLTIVLALPQLSSAGGIFELRPLTVAQDDHIFASEFERYTLTINTSIDSWCSVTVGTDPPAEPPISKDFVDGSVVALHGAANLPNHWAYWTGTDAGGTDVNQDAQVTMSANRYVFACCPLNPTCTN